MALPEGFGGQPVRNDAVRSSKHRPNLKRTWLRSVVRLWSTCMRVSLTILGLLAALAGFVSVYYWWTAARMGPIDVPSSGETPAGGPGDMWLDYGGEKMIFLNYSRQSKLNAQAALWTGISVFFQVAAVMVQLANLKP